MHVSFQRTEHKKGCEIQYLHSISLSLPPICSAPGHKCLPPFSLYERFPASQSPPRGEYSLLSFSWRRPSHANQLKEGIEVDYVELPIIWAKTEKNEGKKKAEGQWRMPPLLPSLLWAFRVDLPGKEIKTVSWKEDERVSPPSIGCEECIAWLVWTSQ